MRVAMLALVLLVSTGAEARMMKCNQKTCHVFDTEKAMSLFEMRDRLPETVVLMGLMGALSCDMKRGQMAEVAPEPLWPGAEWHVVVAECGTGITLRSNLE